MTWEHPVKTRTKTRTRQVLHSIDGIAEMVDEEYDVQVDVLPYDWDHIVLNGLTIAAISLVGISLAWSTASVGDLLDRVAPAFIAYTGALAFDGAWIACLAAEYLARHDAKKAAPPRNAGRIALLVAMAAVFAHGATNGSPWAGVVGALISALAKYVWGLVMRHHATELDPLSRQWLEKRTARIGAELALSSGRRQLARVEGQLAAFSASAAPRAALPEVPYEALYEAPREMLHFIEAPHAAPPEVKPVASPQPPQHDDASPVPQEASHAAPHPKRPAAHGEAPPIEAAPHPAARHEAAEQRTDAPLTLHAPEPPALTRATDEAPQLDGLSKADAVRCLIAAYPAASPLQLVTHLAAQGVAVDASYVRTVITRSRTKRPGPGTGQYL